MVVDEGVDAHWFVTLTVDAPLVLPRLKLTCFVPLKHGVAVTVTLTWVCAPCASVIVPLVEPETERPLSAVTVYADVAEPLATLVTVNTNVNELWAFELVGDGEIPKRLLQEENPTFAVELVEEPLAAW